MFLEVAISVMRTGCGLRCSKPAVSCPVQDGSMPRCLRVVWHSVCLTYDYVISCQPLIGP